MNTSFAIIVVVILVLVGAILGWFWYTSQPVQPPPNQAVTPPPQPAVNPPPAAVQNTDDTTAGIAADLKRVPDDTATTSDAQTLDQSVKGF